MQLNTIRPSILFMSALALAISSTTAQAVEIVNEPNTKAVGHVRWNTQLNINPQQLVNATIPEDSASLFFIRPYDADPKQTSANIAINDRFQVSLQPGSYSQVYSCAGINQISAVATGLYTNDLLLNTSTFELNENETYFFYIDVDPQGNSSIQQITKDSALNALQNKLYQTHQITRVVPNCPVVEEPPAPIVIPEPQVVIPPPPPVLQEAVSIELEILFDNDRAFIKPEYMHEIQQVAEFMQEYSNTTAIIEGHTDSTASDEYNQRLSEMRANAVKNALISRYDIAPDRLHAIGYGEQRPRSSNDSEQGREQNRRVIAVIEERH